MLGSSHFILCGGVRKTGWSEIYLTRKRRGGEFCQILEVGGLNFILFSFKPQFSIFSYCQV